MTTKQLLYSLAASLTFIPISHAAVYNCGNSSSCGANDVNCKRTHRVCNVLKSQSACAQSKLGSFYWEMGNGTNVLAAGRVGNGPLTNPNNTINIASASKWIYATYAEARGLANSPAQKRLLTMRGGHRAFTPTRCSAKNQDGSMQTVSECLQKPGNQYINGSQVNKFYYNGGGMQDHAVNVAGLGGFSSNNIGREYNSVLKNIGFGFSLPAVAGGMKMTPKNYGLFLQGIVRNQWKTIGYLGKDSIAATPPDASDGKQNPSKTNMRYSYGHWVESHTTPLLGGPKGDGAFSSPGVFGFYPWISKNKSFYGLLSRYNRQSDAFRQSAACGQHMRKAWLGN